jgi:hypothetical protein
MNVNVKMREDERTRVPVPGAQVSWGLGSFRVRG